MPKKGFNDEVFAKLLSKALTKEGHCVKANLVQQLRLFGVYKWGNPREKARTNLGGRLVSLMIFDFWFVNNLVCWVSYFASLWLNVSKLTLFLGRRILKARIVAI